MDVSHWDRNKWVTVFSSHSPTVREVASSLGLRFAASASTTNRGIPKFEDADFRKLSGEVGRISKLLPGERNILLDVAADPEVLQKELDEVMDTLGPLIWGKDTDRSRLSTPDPESKLYPRDLYYEEPEDRAM